MFSTGAVPCKIHSGICIYNNLRNQQTTALSIERKYIWALSEFLSHERKKWFHISIQIHKAQQDLKAHWNE